MTTTKAPGSFGIFRREFIALLIERFSSNFGQIDAPILLYLGTRRSSRVSPEQFRFDVLPSINPHQCDCAKRLRGGRSPSRSPCSEARFTKAIEDKTSDFAGKALLT